MANNQFIKTIFIILTSAFILMILLVVVLYFYQKYLPLTGVHTQGIYGAFKIDGVIPPGSTITLFAREMGTNASFIPFAVNITPQDSAIWQFAKGVTGKSYEIQAGLVNNGKIIYRSSSIYVTSPASNQVLTFDVASAKPSGSAIISAILTIDGYIPTGATITLEGKKLGAKDYSVFASNIEGKNAEEISFTQATKGETYEVRALLYNSSGSLIGQSLSFTVVAPALHEQLTLNSTAKPSPTQVVFTPTQKPQPTIAISLITATVTPLPTPQPTQAVMSGVIRFNGQAPANSRIVIFERISATSSYQVAQDNLSPSDGALWQWSGGQTGTLYDLLAVLKQKQSSGTDIDISNSNVLTLAAPATNGTFTINSGFLLSAPGANISVNCGNYDTPSQTWVAGVSFQSITGAAAYWYEIGTSNGGTELTNFTLNATNNANQSFNEQFKNGVTYFARYAYANVPNLLANNVQFSPLSSTVPLRCAK